MVIMGWGEDQGPGQHGGEEAKLATILRAIKANSPSTKTFACKRGNTFVVRSRKVDEKPLCADCGQFDGIVAAYDAQLKVVTDKAYSGFYLHGDDGKPIGGDTPGGQIW